MIQVYADGVLSYDNRLEEYDLQGLKVTSGLNKGGTAEIVMPPDHPAYSRFTSYKTIVEIYRDKPSPLFRGRALYPADDAYNRRTIVCEGEYCFFQDAVSRPYSYRGTPAEIFTLVVGVYNSQVEPVKQFKVGTITVTDPNDYVTLDSENAESVMETVDKLKKRCGGYIIFTTDPEDGLRVVNWYASLEYRSDQMIEFGENLLDFSRNGSNTNLLTAVLPYGAKDETTGQRVTIESVNNGLDYIQDDEAVALRGFIIKPVYWDDVTKPANLLRKAKAYLEANRYIITALQLSALDLSYMDKNIDSYQVGDKIRVRSKPHNVDEDFLLTERTEDLLNPANGTITLGKDKSTLTGADVAGDSQNRGELYEITRQIKSDYALNIANAVQATELALSSLIQQTSEAIKLEVSQTYATNDQLTEAVSSSMTQLADQFLFEFNSLKVTVDENDADARGKLQEIYKYINFDNGAIKLGASDSSVTLTVENDLIVFRKNGEPFGYWDGDDFHTGNIVVEVNERAQFGDFAFIPRSNGSLSFLKVGG
jgi:hypothetical protein